jgi:hypothetical protein
MGASPQRAMPGASSALLVSKSAPDTPLCGEKWLFLNLKEIQEIP